MGLLILFGVLAGIAIVFVSAYRLMAARRRGPVIPMLRIGLASDPTEAQMWALRLNDAGITFRIVGNGSTHSQVFGVGSPGRTFAPPKIPSRRWVCAASGRGAAQDDKGRCLGWMARTWAD